MYNTHPNFGLHFEKKMPKTEEVDHTQIRHKKSHALDKLKKDTPCTSDPPNCWLFRWMLWLSVAIRSHCIQFFLYSRKTKSCRTEIKFVRN